MNKAITKAGSLDRPYLTGRRRWSAVKKKDLLKKKAIGLGEYLIIIRSKGKKRIR